MNVALRRLIASRFCCRNFPKRFFSSTTTEEKFEASKEYTVVDADGIVVCWHPAKKHPYEHTKPLPAEVQAEVEVLDRRQFGRARRLAQPDGPNDNDLQNIFYTNKHVWYPKPRERRMRSVAAPIPKYRGGL